MRQEEEDEADRRAPPGSGRARAGDGLACAGVAGLWRLVGPEGRRGKRGKKGRGRAGPDWSSGQKTIFSLFFSFAKDSNTFNSNSNSRIPIQTEQQTIKLCKDSMNA